MSTYAQNQGEPAQGKHETARGKSSPVQGKDELVGGNGGSAQGKVELAQGNGGPVQNTNRWSTKQLVTMALMCAIAILLSFIEFPIFPAASFLKLDISFVPSAVMGFAYGAGPGVLVGIVCAVAHGAISGNWVGCLMNVIACCAFVIPAAVVYKRAHTFKGGMAGLALSVVCLVIAAIVANLVIDPLLYGLPFEVVAGLIVPAILPFNVIKGIVISLLTAIVYKSISNLITPAKDQVKGR